MIHGSTTGRKNSKCFILCVAISDSRDKRGGVRSMEQLIKEVQKYPCLYDVSSDSYREVLNKKCCWDEVAKAVDSDRK